MTMGALRGLLWTVLALALAVGLCVPGQARAESYEQFVDGLQTTNPDGTDRTEAALMELRAKDITARTAQARKTDSRSASFFGRATSFVSKKLKQVADVVGEAADVVAAYITGGGTEALIEFAGGLADVLVEYGVPLLSRRICPKVKHLIATPACYLVAYGLSKLDDAAERTTKARLRDALDDDDDGRVQRNRDRRYRGDVTIRASTGDINTIALGTGASAVAEIGVARGGDVEIDAATGDVSTVARGRGSRAYRGIGVAEGDGSDITARVRGDVSTSARRGAVATSQVGVASGGADVTAVVGDDVVTHGAGGNATNRIGTSTGRDVNVAVGGSVTTLGDRCDSTTNIGAGKSAYVGGDVVNLCGSLTIGGLCVARRDGQCCIEIHRQLCVLHKVPPDNKGRCPPRFERWGWMCYLYSDKRHSIQR
jgi:hypothetical protein